MLKRLFGARDEAKDALRPLYAAIVTEARSPRWYQAGGVPDTLDGRFDMIALILSIVLLRLERDGDLGRAPAVHLAELFVDDMDPQLRQLGIGDLVVGKHVGRMMGALGGRLTVYRDALASGQGLDEALVRNVWRGTAPAPAVVDRVAGQVHAVAARVAARDLDEVLRGDFG